MKLPRVNLHSGGRADTEHPERFRTNRAQQIQRLSCHHGFLGCCCDSFGVLTGPCEIMHRFGVSYTCEDYCVHGSSGDLLMIYLLQRYEYGQLCNFFAQPTLVITRDLQLLILA